MPTSTDEDDVGFRDQTYCEHRPLAALDGQISVVWVQRISSHGPVYRQRTTPTGCVEVVCRTGAMPTVVGPRSEAVVDHLEPGTTVIGARIAPGAAAPLLLGMPASELENQIVGADQLWGRWGAGFGEQVAGAGRPDQGLQVLQAGLAQLIADGSTEPDPLIARAVQLLSFTDPAGEVSLPDELEISARQLRRRCRAAVGLSPTTLQRIFRFRAFERLAMLAVARGEAPCADGLAVAAARIGYADQAHLTRECRRLTGLTPQAFVHGSAMFCGPENGHDHSASLAPWLGRRAPFAPLR